MSRRGVDLRDGVTNVQRRVDIGDAAIEVFQISLALKAATDREPETHAAATFWERFPMDSLPVTMGRCLSPHEQLRAIIDTATRALAERLFARR